VASALQDTKQTVALCMIVKDESDVILRAFSSVSSLVDVYYICDTGSSDGTQEIILNYFKDNKLEGYVFERPWVNFGYNRTECFKLAKGKADYLMTLDADEVIAPLNDGRVAWEEDLPSLPYMEEDMAFILTRYAGLDYQRATFFKGTLSWEWVGVCHEYCRSDENKTSRYLPTMCNIPRGDGARSKRGNKYKRDALLFEADLIEDPTNSRSWFYLAQSYADAKDYDRALAAVNKGLEVTTWDEEKYMLLLRKGRYKIELGCSMEEVVSDLLIAYQCRPTRAEPLHDIQSYYRKKELYHISLVYGERALGIPYPATDSLFIERDVYDWKVKDDLSIAYYYTGEYEKALALGKELVESGTLPPPNHDRIQENLLFFQQKGSEDLL